MISLQNLLKKLPFLKKIKNDKFTRWLEEILLF